MKTKFTLLTLLLLFFTSINFAQVSFSNADIAVQGIARDDNNTAIAGKSVNFTFTIYYDALAPKNIFTQSTTLQTDAFGVFSHTLNVGTDKIALIANQQAFLRIEADGNTISNEALKHVPYAISANNGVPTGAIMPFIGTVAPPGWHMCDGTPLPTDGSAANLIALVGANAPNLQAMYLRGAGSQNYGGTNYAGIALKDKQKHTVEMHNHAAGSLVTSNSGAHHHISTETYARISSNGTSYFTHVGRNFGAPTSDTRTPSSGENGEHSHTITGRTANGGTAGETRPVSYGVNYIIKL